jgi:DNA polymerase-1
MNPLLVLDTSYLCHRAFHTTAKGLSWRGNKTGVIFSFLKSITSIKDEFQTDRIAFCFEHPHSYRRAIYPSYKRRRMTRKRTEEEARACCELNEQISDLRLRYLPRIGFNNIFSFYGMESDDIMASIAETREEEVILVTGDHDLFQCLRQNVSIYNPQHQKLLTIGWFKNVYGITPKQWAVVKAIAGCTSDEVKGIQGIGEKTALKYMRGELSEQHKAYYKIASSFGKIIVLRNRPLVELPFKGCPVPKIQEDHISKRDWLEVCSELGMGSIASRPPVATRTQQRLNLSYVKSSKR